MSLRNGRSKQACFQGENCRSGIAATKAGASGWASPRTHKSASVIDQEYPAKPARMLGSRPLSRTTAFAPRRDLKREKPFRQERPALFVASLNHNPNLPILSISYLSRFRFTVFSRIGRSQSESIGSILFVFGFLVHLPVALFFVVQILVVLDGRRSLLGGRFRGRGFVAGNDRSQARGVLGHRFLGALHEVSPAPLGRQLRGPGLGRRLLGVVKGGNGLVRVVHHGPDDAHPGGRLGRPARLGLGLGGGLGLLLGLPFRYLLVLHLFDEFFGLVFHGIKGLRGLALTSQFQSIQRFPSHETGPLA